MPFVSVVHAEATGGAEGRGRIDSVFNAVTIFMPAAMRNHLDSVRRCTESNQSKSWLDEAERNVRTTSSALSPCRASHFLLHLLYRPADCTVFVGKVNEHAIGF